MSKKTQQEQPYLGALLMLVCQFFSASAITAVKMISASITAGTIAFINYLVCSCLIIVLLAYKRNIGVKTQYLALHVIRALMGVLFFVSLYWAVSYIPVVNAVLLRSTAPIWAPFIAFIWMRDTISYRVWLGIGVGFVGILLVLQPQRTAINPGYFLGLFSAVVFAVNSMLTHRLNQLKEPLLRTLFYSFLIPAFVLSPYAITHWPAVVSIHQVWLLGFIGLASFLLLFFYVASLRYAPVTIILPISYISIVFAGGYDWILWHQIPRAIAIVGMILVFLSCSFVVWARHRASSV